MSSEWPIVKVVDVCAVGDGAHSKVQRMDSGVLYLTSKNIGQGELKLEKVDYISSESFSKLFPSNSRATRRPEAGDVLLGIIGTFGNAYIYKDSDSFGFSSSIGVLRPNKKIYDSRFLYYVISSPKFKSLHANSDGGSVQGYTNIPTIKNLPLPLPPLVAQKTIAGLLGALDDRISLLRKTNTTLEAIAEALFKSWFVDFDPVRAKMEGLQPEGMDVKTASLFPDSFEESELGLVPKGWNSTRVAEVAEIVRGKTYTSKELAVTHHTALVTLKSFARGGGFRLDGFKPYTGKYKSTQVVVPGDLIIAYTDVTQAAELIGKPVIVVGVDKYQTLVASLDVGIVRPDTNNVSLQYLYGLFRTGSFQSHVFAHTSGTTVLHLAKDGIGSYRFSCPPLVLVQSFSDIANALSERCQSNIDQIQTITQLRDTLLPRLVSGQLHLPETKASIENMLSEAV